MDRYGDSVAAQAEADRSSVLHTRVKMDSINAELVVWPEVLVGQT